MSDFMNETEGKEVESKEAESKEAEGKTKRQRVSTAETSVDLFGTEDYCTVYSTHIKYKNWIKEMKEAHPEDVEILWEDDGIMARMPKGCLKLSWPRQTKEISEEEKEVRRERLKKAREERKKTKEKKGE